MFYKGYVSRKLNPVRYKSPFIGRHSMEVMLGQNREELKRQSNLYEEIKNKKKGVNQNPHFPIKIFFITSIIIILA